MKTNQLDITLAPLLPDDRELLGQMVEDISYNNARRYIKFY